MIANDVLARLQVVLQGAGKRDPLNGVGNLELKLSEDGKQVEGVQLCDECVLYTGASSWVWHHKHLPVTSAGLSVTSSYLEPSR